ncbi:MAG: flavodoxin domain-containing protein, partial [Vulcanimicrobiaceae bacterium]
MIAPERNGAATAPLLGEDAPFTPEQRAWLSGFLAGLFSGPPQAVASAPPQRLTLIVGSQTGTADRLGRTFAKAAKTRGLLVERPVPESVALESLRDATVLFVTSTHGDGEPPDNLLRLYRELHAPEAPRLAGLRFAVLALGDSSYARFAQCGRDLDERLEALGATRLVERVDADLDVEEPFARWSSALFAALAASAPVATSGVTPNGTASNGLAHDGTSAFPASAVPRLAEEDEEPDDREVRSLADVLENRALTAANSSKETRHLALAARYLPYEPGDALAIYPQNGPPLVEEFLVAAGLSGSERVVVDGAARPLGEALREHLAIGPLHGKTVRAYAERTANAGLRALCERGRETELQRYLWGRDAADLVREHRAGLDAAALAELLPPLRPRLYSIASSPHAHPAEIHATVAVVRYHAYGRA